MRPDLDSRRHGGGFEDGSWANWSGSMRFTPARVERPQDEDALVRIVSRAANEGRTVRVVGAGHSSSPLVATDETLVSLERMQGVVRHDRDASEAVVRAGMSIHDASQELLRVGLMMHNWGDVDVQTVVGAVATGTHGSGARMPNLAWMLVGARVVTGTGDVQTVEDEASLRGLRCGMGATGIVTEARLRLRPAFRIQRTQWCLRTDDCLDQVATLARKAPMCDFYWYPRSDLVKLRLGGEPGKLPEPQAARCVKDTEGWGSEVVPQTRNLRFEEMEYALPAHASGHAFEEVRDRMRTKHRKHVGWRVLWRMVQADDAYLSEAHGRDTVTLSLHQNVGLPYQAFFDDMEPIFLQADGRPHWGKKHSLDAASLRPRYPAWDRFHQVRRRMDPDGTFLTPYLRRLLGVDA